jgi:2-C-methyl-D-erythritol 4-phosphate cytidylyltransferase / 2-C-methyl-D-erythritol 2,4-cyclodiphosphate synthase
MAFSALIVAAGQGERAGSGAPKQWRRLRGREVLLWSVDAMARAGAAQIVVVVAADRVDPCRNLLAGRPAVTVQGGATRTASVRAGLQAIGAHDFVLIHDSARPGLTAAHIPPLLQALEHGADGAAPALPLADALHRSDGGGVIDRAGLVRAQTPQAFHNALIKRAYDGIPSDAVFADDIAVAQAAGARIVFTPGDIRLMKLTYPEDFATMERMLGGVTCVGAGFDAHRFGPGDHVTLCGVRIPHSRGLLGHSDADAGWHALVDAILGALGRGDIGAHFPPSDPQWKGADSERFLRHAVALANQAGARIQHVDITIISEQPRIGPHRDAMRARTAEMLGLPIERVSVKATTTERMGFTGREEGLAAQAMATLECVE